MRILHIISGMDPKQGGVSQALRTMISKLSEIGIENEVVCMDDPSSDFLVHEKFKIFPLGTGITAWSFNPKLLGWLTMNIPNYNIIVVHGLWQYHSYATYKAASRLDGNCPKFFVMPHGMLDPYFQKAKGRKMKAVRNWIFWKFVEEKVIKKADGLLFTCETEKILARQTFSPYQPKHENVVGLGVETPPLFLKEMKSVFQSKVNGLGNEKYFLFISRINEKKSVDLLIKAYLNLKKKYINIPKLVVAGPGLETSYGQFIKKLASGDKDIFFPGMLYQDEKWGAFYGCEAFILPSHQENFGIAVVEALACGKPVLISNQINIWREIADEGAGIIESDTLEGTQALMDKWMQMTPEDKETMIMKTKKAFERNFAAKAAAERFMAALSPIKE